MLRLGRLLTLLYRLDSSPALTDYDAHALRTALLEREAFATSLDLDATDEKRKALEQRHIKSLDLTGNRFSAEALALLQAAVPDATLDFYTRGAVLQASPGQSSVQITSTNLVLRGLSSPQPSEQTESPTALPDYADSKASAATPRSSSAPTPIIPLQSVFADSMRDAEEAEAKAAQTPEPEPSPSPNEQIRRCSMHSMMDPEDVDQVACSLCQALAVSLHTPSWPINASGRNPPLSPTKRSTPRENLARSYEAMDPPVALKRRNDVNVDQPDSDSDGETTTPRTEPTSPSPSPASPSPSPEQPADERFRRTPGAGRAPGASSFFACR